MSTKGFAMKKLTFPATALAVALGAGCFGSDPNVPSMLLNPDAGNPGLTGSGGSPALSVAGTALATFDTGTDGFMIDPYHDANQTNIADPAWISASGQPAPTLSFESADGSPDPGSLKVVAPFNGKDQHVDLQGPAYPVSATKNWAGGKLHVHIKVASGAFASGGAQVFVKTTASYIYGATYTNVTGTGWKDYLFNMDAPMYFDTGYDDSQVISFGVQLNTGSSAMNQGPVTFQIDSFSVSGVSGGAAGAGGTTGSAGAGGTTGSAGAGGTTGSAGAGGTTGSAGAGG